MRFIHLSDLHLGKKLKEFSLLEDQRYILSQIVDIVGDNKPDCVFIAGDVYDKSVPPADAVTMFDDFLVALRERTENIFIISGNHDSMERIAFGSRFFDRSGVHFSPVFDGTLRRYTVNDEYGEVGIYMLPYLRPANIRHLFPDREINSYTDAVTAAIDAADIDYSGRNILLSHQFVTGGVTCDSEQLVVGGLENVDGSAYDGFDYVALGHLHGGQDISATMRYCGTPLKYSLSECKHKKSVTIGTIGKKGELDIDKAELVPMRDLREETGSFEEFIKGGSDDYISIILTDEVRVPEAFSRLRQKYQNLIKTDYVSRAGFGTDDEEIIRTKDKAPVEIFSGLFEKMNGKQMTEQQQKTVSTLIERIWRESE